MSKYKIGPNCSSILNTELGMTIPINGGNRHFKEFVEWFGVDDKNNPDCSMTSDEFKEAKKPEASETYDVKVAKGYTCKSGIKYDCKMSDLTALVTALNLAGMMNNKTIDVRDYDNVVHKLKLDEISTDIKELAKNHKKLLKEKWKNQANASGRGYTAFLNAELRELKRKIKKA